MSSEQPEPGNTPVATTENDNANAADTRDTDKDTLGTFGEPVESAVTDVQRDAFYSLLSTIYEHRTENGLHDPSKLFHRKPNRRTLPSYYDVIKEPLALSTIKARLNLKQYMDVASLVRDFALIPHNAQVYNRPDAGAYLDALEIKRVLEQELNKLIKLGVIDEEEGKLPYLGEIPDPDPPAGDEAGEEETEDDDEESGEESDESGGRRRGRGRPKGSRAGKRDDADHTTEFDPHKRRGRPPRVDTPTEARIKNIMKALRRHKQQDGQLKIGVFERLPDEAVVPEYYAAIKNPIAIDVIKKRLRRKKYLTMEQFMKDINLMFDNAKSYNEDDSQIYQIAAELQREAYRIADEEKARPDADFVDEEGRIPLPNGVMHNGELYRVGDWVHIQNANDLTKPVPSQIYRTWQDASGNKFVNTCWYYRPEQTVHRFDRHFYENEIVKTGQYRDHHVDEIVDRCFIMFITRYPKGRPRNFPQDKEIYVCESRYNEAKQQFNKIKTWTSCLPDEVRDKDYEMELFKDQRGMRKLPSPIAYLLKDEQKETDNLPKPTWGADNAPPKIGAVHRRPRDPKESPPPAPTPPLPPIPDVKAPSPTKPQQPLGQVPPNSTSLSQLSSTPVAQRTLANNTQSQVTSQQRPLLQQQGGGSLPATLGRGNSNFQNNNSYTTAQTPGRMAQPQSQNTNSAPAVNRNIAPAVAGQAAVQNYQAPQPVEVYHLQDAVNNNIPPDIRRQFQCDDFGRLLFFTTPPIDVRARERQGADLAHSARYLAKMQRRAEEREKKRRQAEEMREDEKRESSKAQAKRRKTLENKAGNLSRTVEEMWRCQIQDTLEVEGQALYGENWKELLDRDLQVSRMEGIAAAVSSES